MDTSKKIILLRRFASTSPSRLMSICHPKKLRSEIASSTAEDEVSATTAPSLTSSSEATTSSNYTPDIGIYVKKIKIDLSSKVELLERHWVPPANYDFPHCLKKKNGKETEIFLQKSHLEKFNWLVLSHKDQGLYCKYCVIYSKGFKSKTNLKCLVKEPLKSFDDLLSENGVLFRHERDKYHHKAVADGKSFLHRSDIFPKPSVDSRVVIDQKNREQLKPIVKTIILCGQQNIPIRGNRDEVMDDQEIRANNGRVLASAEESFNALLDLHVESSDLAVQDDLETAESNALYKNKTVQNKLINVCAEIIQRRVLENVKKAKYFSILFDEVTDTSLNTQLSLSVRYLHNKIVMEDFLTFCDINDGKKLTFDEKVGVALAQFVENICNKFDINLTLCVGIGIDNCSAMAAATKEAVVRELLKRAVHAKRCPSSNYILSNSLALVSCRNTAMTMRKVVEFANASVKRQQMFAGTSISTKRWDEIHDGHQLFQGENLIEICSALERISKWPDNETASVAHCLLHTVRNSDFIISLTCLTDILGVTVTLSKILQRPTSALDLRRARDTLENTKSALREKKKLAARDFPQIFEESKQLAGQLGVELKSPRVDNLSVQPVDKYSKEFYVSLLDLVINDLDERMSSEVVDLFQLGVFISEMSSDVNDLQSVKQLARNYASLIDNVSSQAVESEYKLWMVDQTDAQTLSETIEKCDEGTYAYIPTFLRILAALPMSIALKGRSFSTLSLLRSWLRLRTEENCLTGLALLYIHKNVPIDVENVIEIFMKQI